MNNKVAFCTLGCKVNQYETDAMKELFLADGYTVVDFSDAADVYVVNTCTVTNMADRKSRQMLHRAKKKNPKSIIVAAGCYVQAAKEQLEQDEMIDLVIGNNMKNQAAAIVDQFIQAQNDHEEGRHEYVIDIAHEQQYEKMMISSVSEHTRAYIKIQDGCNQFCSYCIIPYARGRVRSRKMEEIIDEVSLLAENGYKEIVLTGIHISSYGLDFVHQTSESAEEDYGAFHNSALIDLLEQIARVEGIERIRFGSLEPRIITEQFLERLSLIEKICPHFHLSLQSGCDATLNRMNRHYTAALYAEKCALIRRYFDRPAITTDVIVGFPGETEEEFESTAAFLEKIHFADMHIFKYSKRKGTRAAKMPDQVSPDIQTKRSDRLLLLAQTMHSDFIKECTGQVQEVLLEEPVEVNGIQYVSGYSKSYVRCLFDVGNEPLNTVIKGIISEPLNEEFVICKRID